MATCVIAGKYKPMSFDQGPNKGQGPLDGGALAHPALSMLLESNCAVCLSYGQRVLASERMSGPFVSLFMHHA